MKIRISVLLIIAISLNVMATACNSSQASSTSEQTSILASSILAETTTSAATTMSTIQTPQIIGTIEVNRGDILERDIIPQLCLIFKIDEKTSKSMMADSGKSILIRQELQDFRRFEGIIPPGRYDVLETWTLSDLLSSWIQAAEQRFAAISSKAEKKNKLNPQEQLILASMIEAECLAGKHQEEAAAVFLNRLDDGSKLQSCVTAEYALGYQRPFLNSDDLKVNSSYNTYAVDGLPAGPICSPSDDCIKAAVSIKMDQDIYFFYYDYILNDMFFFEDYSKFQAACVQSRELFKAESAVGMRDKINKQDLYGSSD